MTGLLLTTNGSLKRGLGMAFQRSFVDIRLTELPLMANINNNASVAQR
ncbi:hypothetical protein ACFL02_02030 [Planctomycetota bacterium]